MLYLMHGVWGWSFTKIFIFQTSLIGAVLLGGVLWFLWDTRSKPEPSPWVHDRDCPVRDYGWAIAKRCYCSGKGKGLRAS